MLPGTEVFADLTGHAEAVMSSTVSPDGKTLLTAGYDGAAKLWSLSTGARVRTFEGRNDCGRGVGGLYSAFFSPDASTILTASSDGVARLWRTADGECIWALRGHADTYMRYAIFSPTEPHILTSSADMTAKLWHMDDRRLVCTYRGHTGWLNTASFTSDGKLVCGCYGPSLANHHGRACRNLRGTQALRAHRRLLHQ